MSGWDVRTERNSETIGIGLRLECRACTSSLKVGDTSGLEFSYNPHFCDAPHHKNGTAAFEQLTWLGFTSNAASESVFYVDNVSIENH